MYITRIAPSPTGSFHIGTARTAYINYLTAKNSGGKFILRIDDTDLDRNNDLYIANIIDTMKWLNLDHDLCFRQSQRFDHYKKLADNLVNQKRAYIKDNAIILNVGIFDKITKWNDDIIGDIPVNDDVNDIVLIKSNGTPTYHFATVVDDIDYDINFVIRGTDHILNTTRQLYIYNALDCSSKIPKYAHVGLIHKDGKKISKRDNICTMKYYQDNDYDPDAILNSLLFLGWGHPNPNFDRDNPIVDKNLAIKIFNQGKLRSVSSNLNINKLDFLNKKYKKIKCLIKN